jgi:Ca2+-binding RTX toxin-like protein
LNALQFEEEPDMPSIAQVRLARAVLLEGIDNAILRLIESHPETEVSPGEFDTGLIVEFLFADQLDKAIEKLVELKDKVIEVFGQSAANEEVVPQIDNMVEVLENQELSASPPPESDCVGAGSRNSIITGTPDPDILIGTSGSNIINGLGGGDSINGCGGNDVINGNAGNDGIAGGAHNDNLNGNEGNDVIEGNSGNDKLAGGPGINYLTGGSGRNAFICDPHGETYVTDFQRGKDAITGPCILTTTTTTPISSGPSTSVAPGSAPPSTSSVPMGRLPVPLPS